MDKRKNSRKNILYSVATFGLLSAAILPGVVLSINQKNGNKTQTAFVKNQLAYDLSHLISNRESSNPYIFNYNPHFFDGSSQVENFYQKTTANASATKDGFMYQTQNGDIFVGDNNGILRQNPTTKNFDSVSTNNFEHGFMYQTQDGKVYAGGANGLFKQSYDPTKAESFDQITTITENLTNGFMYQTQDGTIFVGNSKGLFEYKNGILTQMFAGTNGIGDLSHGFMYQTKDGHIFVGSQSQGLFKLAYGANGFTSTPIANTAALKIDFMYQTSENIIYIGDKDGLCTFDEGTNAIGTALNIGAFDHGFMYQTQDKRVFLKSNTGFYMSKIASSGFQASSFLKMKNSDDVAGFILQAQDGNLYMGSSNQAIKTLTFETGINNLKNGFMYQTKDGNIFVGQPFDSTGKTSSGVLRRYDDKWNVINSWNIDCTGSQMISIDEDESELLMTTKEGLFKIIKSNGSIEVDQLNNENMLGQKLFKTANGKIFLTTATGVKLFENGAFKAVGTALDISDGFMYQVNDGNIFIGTKTGLYAFDAQNNVIGNKINTGTGTPTDFTNAWMKQIQTNINDPKWNNAIFVGTSSGLRWLNSNGTGGWTLNDVNNSHQEFNFNFTNGFMYQNSGQIFVSSPNSNIYELYLSGNEGDTTLTPIIDDNDENKDDIKAGFMYQTINGDMYIANKNLYKYEKINNLNKFNVVSSSTLTDYREFNSIRFLQDYFSYKINDDILSKIVFCKLQYRKSDYTDNWVDARPKVAGNYIVRVVKDETKKNEPNYYNYLINKSEYFSVLINDQKDVDDVTKNSFDEITNIDRNQLPSNIAKLPSETIGRDVVYNVINWKPDNRNGILNMTIEVRKNDATPKLFSWKLVGFKTNQIAINEVVANDLGLQNDQDIDSLDNPVKGVTKSGVNFEITKWEKANNQIIWSANLTIGEASRTISGEIGTYENAQKSKRALIITLSVVSIVSVGTLAGIFFYFMRKIKNKM